VGARPAWTGGLGGSTPTPTVHPGSNFGPYRVLEQLGRGGMAAVYRAYEPSLDRYVALKVLPAESLTDPEFTVRFRREAKVIAGLEHRHIVPIYAYGIENGVPWMAMRLVSGGTVAVELGEGPLSLARTVEILAEVAAALDFAHQHGVLHRDVKPQNILLDEQGHAYLADFGVARMMEGTSAVTRSGVVTGTPLYMSPEQARGEKVDHRTDIYALGIVAYEMVTGRVPFTADTPVAVLMKHIMEPIPLPPASEVPEPVLRAILKSVAKDRADRWQDARRFVAALRNAVHGSQTAGAWISAQPTRTHVRWLPAPHNPFAVAVGWGGLLLCLLIALYYGLRPRGDLPVARPTPAVTPTPAPWTATATPIVRAPTAPSPSPRSRVPAPVAPPSPPPTSEPQLHPALPGSGTSVPHSMEGMPAATPRAEPATPTLAPSPSALPSPDPSADGVSFLIGGWKGLVRQKKNPFIHRELERAVRTECKQLYGPRRVFCRNNWGIIEDWLVVRHDVSTNEYFYEDSDGLTGSGRARDDTIIYQGTRSFDGRSLAWRMTHHTRGPDAFELSMEWSRDSRDWYTIYDAAFHRNP
jgi:serine/threonine protein kinase